MWQITSKKMCLEIINSVFGSGDGSNKRTCEFHIASTVEEARKILQDHKIHLFLLDKDLGTDTLTSEKIHGVDQITEFKSIQPLTQILMLTADLSVKDITRAMRLGATDYLFKSDSPEDVERRVDVIGSAIAHYAEQLNQAKASAPAKTGLYSNYVCESLAMQRLDNKLSAIAESSRPVLLLGDTGLGKGAVARRINELTRNALSQTGREFVQINIAATERNLVDSILFGTEPGAFTDASKQTKPGLLDAARGGDIFIDEIGDASPELQLKLLKVVEEREYNRVGGTKPIKTDARFIFATNQDLYMRIAVFEETLPALSERAADIPAIVKGFIASALKNAKNKHLKFEDFPEDLLSYFLREDIPGNIRGIENDVERLVAHIPYDSEGKAQLKHWKKALGQKGQIYARKPQILNMETLLKSNTHFLDSDFPGLWAATELLEKRIFEEIDLKKMSLEQASKLLKVSINTVWTRRKQLQVEQRGIKQ
jgi:DNA-binding NtrC family response regulator